MWYAITKRLEICIDINIGLGWAAHYTWIFTSRIVRVALEITFFTKQVFFSRKWLTSYSRKVENVIRVGKGGVLIKAGGLKMFWKKLNGGGRVGGTLIRDPRVFGKMITGLLLKVFHRIFCQGVYNLDTWNLVICLSVPDNPSGILFWYLLKWRTS